MPGRVRGLNSPAGDPGASGLNVVPGKLNGEWVTHIQFGDYGERVLAAMRRTVASLTELGCNVIVDDLLFERAYLDDYVQVLDPNKTWFIGVKCSLDVVHQREALRPGRFPGTAVSHYEQVHAHGAAYDLEVDTSDAKATDLSYAIIARLQRPPKAFKLFARKHLSRNKNDAQQLCLAHAVLTFMAYISHIPLSANKVIASR